MVAGGLQHLETRFFKHAASSLLQLRLIEKQSAMVNAVEDDQLTQFMLHGFETTLTDIFMTICESPSLMYQIEMPESVVAPFMTQKAALAYAVNLKKRLLEASGGVGFGVELESPHQVADLKGGGVQMVLPPKTRKMPLSEFPHLRHYSEHLLRELLRAVTQTVAAITTSKYLAELKRTVELERVLEKEETKQKRMLVNAVDELVVFKERVRALEEEIKLKDESNKSSSLFRSKAKRQQHLNSIFGAPSPTAASSSATAAAAAPEVEEEKEIERVGAPPLSSLAPAPQVRLNDRDYIDQQTDRLVDKLVTNRLLTILAGKEEFKVFNRQIEDLTASVAELTAEKAGIRVKFDAKAREAEVKEQTIAKLNIELTYKAKEVGELQTRLDQAQDSLDSVNEKYEGALLARQAAPHPPVSTEQVVSIVAAPAAPARPAPTLEMFQPDMPAIRMFPSGLESRRAGAIKKAFSGKTSPPVLNANGLADTAVTASQLAEVYHQREVRFRLDMVATDGCLIRAEPPAYVEPPVESPDVPEPEAAAGPVANKKSRPTKTMAERKSPTKSASAAPGKSASKSPSDAREPAKPVVVLESTAVDRAVQTMAPPPRELAEVKSYYSDDEEDQSVTEVALPLFRIPSRTVDTQTDFADNQRRAKLKTSMVSEAPAAAAAMAASADAISTPPKPEVGRIPVKQQQQQLIQQRQQQQQQQQSEIGVMPIKKKPSLRISDEEEFSDSSSDLSPGALMQEAMAQLLLVDAGVRSDEVEELPTLTKPRVARVGEWTMAAEEVPDGRARVEISSERRRAQKKISYAALAERTDAGQLARVFERLYVDALERLERVKGLVEDSDTAKQMKLEKIFCVFRAVTSLTALSEGVSPGDFRTFFSHYVEATPHKPLTNFWLANNFFARRKRWPKREAPGAVELPSISINNYFVSHLPNKHM